MHDTPAWSQDPALNAAAQTLGSRLTRATALSGGDINRAHAVRLEDGRRVFVKTNPSAPEGMFAAEARGLAWLAETSTLRVPQVLALSSEQQPGFLVLELLEPGPRRPGFDEELGRGLADLHRSMPPRFGLDHDNFIGRLPQDNALRTDWATFYAECRLEPQVQRATDSGRLPPALQRRLSQVIASLPNLCGQSVAPSRLHGDLWGGNLHVDENGGPVLIDPAVYAGHREVDLAMMRLFGGFNAKVFAAYEEHWPLAAGASERVPLYQLYPLLVHVNHFGASYLSSLEEALGQLP